MARVLKLLAATDEELWLSQIARRLGMKLDDAADALHRLEERAPALAGCYDAGWFATSAGKKIAEKFAP